jgi:hypothetical protein
LISSISYFILGIIILSSCSTLLGKFLNLINSLIISPSSRDYSNKNYFMSFLGCFYEESSIEIDVFFLDICFISEGCLEEIDSSCSFDSCKISNLLLFVPILVFLLYKF